MHRLVAAVVTLAAMLPVAAFPASLPPVESATGLVVAAQRLAAEAGAEILRQGGSAIDAAVATGYAEAVVDPCCGNIGGGGFLTASLPDGKAVFINFRETAPAAASAGMYLDAAGSVIPGASLVGWRAAGVPGTVMGLDTALIRYGTLPRAVVMAPAIRLARAGFTLGQADADILARSRQRLAQDPVAAAVFLHPDGTSLRPGEVLRQPDLADTLQAIARDGPAAFYAGRIPAAVETASRHGGGLLTAADFAAYRAPVTEPIRCTYRGFTILSAPPPSSGGTTLCETLNILSGYDMRALGFHGAQSIHLMTEALRLAYRDRNTSLGDPDFVANPVERLLSDAHAAHLRSLIGPNATPSASLPADPDGVGAGEAPAGAKRPAEKTETTHYSVIDAHGGAVSVTFTLNGFFGAGVMAPGTGFLLNDEMDDFSLKPGVANQFGLVQGAANAIVPGKRPLSSMAPTIVLHDSRIAMVLGSPGGARIITAVLQTLMNVIDHGMTAQEAVDAPRLHHQWLPDVLFAEPYALSPDTQAELARMGYRIVTQAPWSAVELIAADPATTLPPPLAASGRRETMGDDAVAGHEAAAAVYAGANDPRRPAGAAVAP